MNRSPLPEVLSRLFGFHGSPIHAPARAGEVKHSVADISKAGRAFGYRPEFTLEEGLGEMV